MLALDAMGGDFAPRATVEGALNAAKQNIPVTLFGDQDIIIPLLHTLDARWEALPLSVVHCSEVIEMGHEPSKSVLKKTDSSLVRAMQSVVQGHSLAVISAGNSGAVLVAATLILGRAPKILRPAIGDFLPQYNGSIFCIDLGANTDPKPEYLLQFAKMGHVYVHMTKNIESPRIALLSNGSEPYKGSLLVKQAYTLLEQSNLNFIGNVESRDIFRCDADVLVCDGFVGNVLLKALQGTAGAISHWLKQEATNSWLSKLYFYLGSSIFRKLKRKTDYSAKGGALLLGLQHPCIVAHGCSNAKAVEQAIVFAYQIAQENFIKLFNEQVALLSEGLSVSAAVSQKLRALFGFRHHHNN